MDEHENPSSKIRPFQPRQLRKLAETLPVVAPPELPPAVAKQKFGLYPLAEDVVISLPLYRLILVTLEQGTAEDRTTVATMMRTAFDAPYT